MKKNVVQNQVSDVKAIKGRFSPFCALLRIYELYCCKLHLKANSVSQRLNRGALNMRLSISINVSIDLQQASAVRG